MLCISNKLICAVKESIVISDHALKAYLSKSEGSADLFGTLLIRDGVLSRRYVGKLISDCFNISYIELSTSIYYRYIFNVISTEYFLRFNSFPLYVIADTITIASSDPFNIRNINQLSKLLNYKVNTVYSFSDEIRFFLTKINSDLLCIDQSERLLISQTNKNPQEREQLINKLANHLISRDL